jgi:hypothetical protein
MGKKLLKPPMAVSSALSPLVSSVGVKIIELFLMLTNKPPLVEQLSGGVEQKY